MGYDSAEPTLFQGWAHDPEEGMLSGESLRWYSDRDGLIGTGKGPFLVQLNVAGETTPHVITLEATDTDGHKVSQSVTITLMNPN